MNNITTLSQKKASELKIGDEVANMGVVLGYRHNDPVITVKFRTNEGEDILRTFYYHEILIVHSK